MAPYWMHVFLPINRKLKNGIHLVEAEEWRKGWWKVKAYGALRATMVSPRIWNANPTIPYTGQPFGIAMQELERRHDGKSNKPLPEQTGPVCELGPATAPESPAEIARASAIRPDRLHRPRRVRKARNSSLRGKAKAR